MFGELNREGDDNKQRYFTKRTFWVCRVTTKWDPIQIVLPFYVSDSGSSFYTPGTPTPVRTDPQLRTDKNLQ